MAVTISPVVIADDTFEDWVIVTNALCNVIGTQVLTANTSAGLTSGNAILVGMLQSNVFVVNTNIRGGNLVTSAPIALGSNLDFGGMTLVGNSSSQINIGSDVSANNTVLKTPILFLGTGTAINANATHFSIRNVIANVSSVNVASGNTLTMNTGTFANLTVNNFTANDLTVNTGTFANLNANNLVANDITTNTATFTNATIENLSVDNMVVDSISQGPSVSVGNAIQLFAISDNTSTSMSTINSFQKSAYRATEYYITTSLNSANAHQVAKLLVIHDRSDAYLTEFGTISTNNDFTLYQVSTNSTHIRLQANTSASGKARGLAIRMAAT